MTDPARESKSIDGKSTDGKSTDGKSANGVDRRTLLKGTAAAGMAGTALTGTASAHDNEIVFESVTDERFEYRVRVSGEIHRGDWTESSDVIVDRDTAKGAVAGGGVDDFVFSGRIKDLDLKGPGKVFVNGDLVRDTSKKEKLPNTITIEGRGERVDYKFRVSGKVRKGDRATAADEVLDSNVVRGAVAGKGADNYHYSGSIAFDSTDGPLRVCLDLDEH